MSHYNIECPHCQRAITISPDRETTNTHFFSYENTIGPVGLYSSISVCPNPECKKIIVKARVSKVSHSQGYSKELDEIKSWQLMPDDHIKKFPDYIPIAIRNDYEEALLISKLSPKASATLSRRALQGILRDFWKVKPQNLNLEIEEIEKKIDAITWDAIDSVRKIGNIGAHMGKDINVIVEVDPGEALLLLSLIETLLTEWYVARADREERMKAIKKVADEKNGGKK